MVCKVKFCSRNMKIHTNAVTLSINACSYSENVGHKGSLSFSADVVIRLWLLPLLPYFLKRLKLLFTPRLGKRLMSTKLKEGKLQTIYPFMAFGQHNVWCERLSHCDWKSSSSGGHQHQTAWTCNQSAAVSGEGGDQSFMEASILVALSSACWCSSTASASKS